MPSDDTIRDFSRLSPAHRLWHERVSILAIGGGHSTRTLFRACNLDHQPPLTSRSFNHTVETVASDIDRSFKLTVVATPYRGKPQEDVLVARSGVKSKPAAVRVFAGPKLTS